VPDALLFCQDAELILKVEALAKSQSFRLKSISDLELAKGWLRLRKFDLALIPSSLEVKEQEQLATLLWERNPMGRFLIVGWDPDDSQAPAARLFGAEVVCGPDALARLQKIFETFKPAAGDDDKPHHILVVEDLESPREIICILIESLGYRHVLGVNSGAAALAELRNAPDKYACVVADIKMPHMNGAELIQAMREDTGLSRIPVVVLTAYGTVDWLVECLHAGASGFLLKPPKKKDMRRELARAMRVFSHGLDPRLVKEQDAVTLRRILEERGLV